jgi:hypothetical protein
MGLIREPKNVDFYVVDKPWSAAEKKEFSQLIKKLKSRPKNKKMITRKKVKAKAA